MKLVVYNLNPDGTIPDYVIDGGYLVAPNDNLPPQDLDLIGVATDAAPQSGFVDEAELLTYAQSKNLVFLNPITQEVIPLETVVLPIWSKLNN
jgi:hypothetical protein